MSGPCEARDPVLLLLRIKESEHRLGNGSKSLLSSVGETEAKLKDKQRLPRQKALK